MSYKCPYCLYPFTTAVENREREGIVTFHCPNPKRISENSERPLCGKMLPLNYLESESIVIALTGGFQVGKTYFYLALLDQLINNRSLHQLGIQGDIVGSNEDKKEITRFFKKIRDGNRLDATVASQNAIKSIIHLTITRGRRVKHVYLSFFDNPGEKFSDLDYMINNFSNVYKADALLFLIDPKQVEKLFEAIAKHNPYLVNEGSGADDLYSVLNNVIQLIKHVTLTQNTTTNSERQTKWDIFVGNFLKSNRQDTISGKIATPIALAISKFDLLKKSLHITIPFDETQLESMCIKDGSFNEEFVNAVSSEIDDFITGPPDGEARIKNLLKSSVKHYAFFGVKSIDVDESGNPITLNPQGVLISLIWLLKKLNLY